MGVVCCVLRLINGSQLTATEQLRQKDTQAAVASKQV